MHKEATSYGINQEANAKMGINQKVPRFSCQSRL